MYSGSAGDARLLANWRSKSTVLNVVSSDIGKRYGSASSVRWTVIWTNSVDLQVVTIFSMIGNHKGSVSVTFLSLRV